MGGAGTLYQLKNVLQKTEQFFYLNGDSLFFPSDPKQLSVFEEDFLKTGADGSFFVCPVPFPHFDFGALWCDSDLNLKFIGTKRELPKKLNSNKLSAFYFSGLALFKSALLDSLKSHDFHLFQDFINPLLGGKKIKVFVDQTACILEAGEKPAYIESLKFCMECLFETEKVKTGRENWEKDKNFEIKEYQSLNQKSDNTQDINKGIETVENEMLERGRQGEIKKILEACFARFDPQDQIVGLKNGRVWSKKLGCPLLAPKSVRGLEKLELKGAAVLGSEVQLFGRSVLKDSVLGFKVSWRGELNKDIVLK